MKNNSLLYGYASGVGKFTCRICGGKFDLSPGELIFHKIGYICKNPNICLECGLMDFVAECSEDTRIDDIQI